MIPAKFKSRRNLTNGIFIIREKLLKRIFTTYLLVSLKIIISDFQWVRMIST